MIHLTPRQREVCGYLCRGWSNKAIAMHMNLSPRTIESHRQAVMRKYIARNPVELVRAVYGIREEVAI